MTDHAASQALRDAARVASRVALVSYKKAGPGAQPGDNVIETARIGFAELRPWLVEAQFLVYFSHGKWRKVEYEYVSVGIALCPPPISLELAEGDEASSIAARAAVVNRQFDKHVANYRLQSELLLRGHLDQLAGLRVDEHAGKLHRNHAFVAALYRGLEGSQEGRVTEMARILRTHRATVSRAIDAAVEAGLLNEAERSRRSRKAA